MFEEPYTLFAAFIGSTMLTMATHGTDQDMVQRMLTAPNYRKSQLSLVLSGLMDMPIAAGFLTVGILLSVHYAVVPGTTLARGRQRNFRPLHRARNAGGFPRTHHRRRFRHHDGLDLRRAQRARDQLHERFLSSLHQSRRDRPQSIRAARIATAIFGVLMIIVATMAAHAVLQDAKLTIIPIAIGILGYTYGALLGVFLLGMLTRSRGARRRERHRHDHRHHVGPDPLPCIAFRRSICSRSSVAK